MDLEWDSMKDWYEEYDDQCSIGQVPYPQSHCHIPDFYKFLLEDLGFIMVIHEHHGMFMYFLLPILICMHVEVNKALILLCGW